MYSVFSSDKVVYLFGKASPRLSLFLAILLRMVPRIKGEAKRIHTARRGLGKGIDQGSLWQRMKNGIRIFSMLISWTIGSLATMSDSMRVAPQDEAGLTTTFQTWPRGWFHIPKDPDFPVPS